MVSVTFGYVYSCINCTHGFGLRAVRSRSISLILAKYAMAVGSLNAEEDFVNGSNLDPLYTFALSPQPSDHTLICLSLNSGVNVHSNFDTASIDGKNRLAEPK